MKFVLVFNYSKYKYHLQSIESKIIKKVIEGEDRWFEEISQEYEDAIYEYDDYPDELSLGHQMDLGRLIDNYDIPEDCYEDVISIYEYYDTDEPEQNIKKNNPNNFQVHDLGEEEFLKIEQVEDQNEEVQSVMVKQQEREQPQTSQKNDKKSKQNKKQSGMNFRKKHKK
ncbi:unnamed protein product [Paramecium sonneborni]|uniref:Uncharacterized protein n=1 Tax=Paramecium sonneborni TaxID=65129 RepID=A0A8S1R2L3_9CILI|nr:unnamed protein product [Paramecium sonneborni]